MVLHLTSVADVPFEVCFMLEKQHQPNQLCVNTSTLSLNFQLYNFKLSTKSISKKMVNTCKSEQNINILQSTQKNAVTSNTLSIILSTTREIM